MSRLGNLGGRLYRGEVSYDFVGRKRRWYAISGAILLISIVALFVRGLDFSVDFKGGAVFQFTAPSVTQSQVENTVTHAGVDGAENWNTAPPLKSTLKSRPWMNRASTLTSRMAPEIVYHLRLRPTKS